MQGICRRNLVTKEGYHIVEELQTVDLNAPNTYPSRLPKYIAFANGITASWATTVTLCTSQATQDQPVNS